MKIAPSFLAPLLLVSLAAASLIAPAIADDREPYRRSESRSERDDRRPEPRSESERHQNFATDRVEDHFRYEYQIGSGYIKVTDSKVSPDETLPVQGWSGRFRTSGKAHVEYFDSQTRTFGRLSREFEIVTEENQDGNLKVMSLRVR
jgi:hypothetical protein